MDLTVLRKNGVEFPVDITLSPAVTSEGNLSVAFITDITERKRTEAALRESKERLRPAQEIFTSAHLTGTFRPA
jgi:PAS domain-containing protein